MESKAGSKRLFYRASLSENRFALFRTHSREQLIRVQMDGAPLEDGISKNLSDACTSC